MYWYINQSIRCCPMKPFPDFFSTMQAWDEIFVSSPRYIICCLMPWFLFNMRHIYPEGIRHDVNLCSCFSEFLSYCFPPLLCYLVYSNNNKNITISRQTINHRNFFSFLFSFIVFWYCFCVHLNISYWAFLFLSCFQTYVIFNYLEVNGVGIGLTFFSLFLFLAEKQLLHLITSSIKTACSSSHKPSSSGDNWPSI